MKKIFKAAVLVPFAIGVVVGAYVYAAATYWVSNTNNPGRLREGAALALLSSC